MNDETMRFLAHNNDLPFAWPGVTARFIEGQDGQLAMMLEIGPATTQQNLRDVWSEIREWRKRLTSWQGAWGSTTDNIYDQLLQQKNNDVSYRVLAQSVNKEIEDSLRAFAKARQDVASVDPSWEWLGGPGRGIFAVHRARELLRALLPGKDPEVWILSAVENIEAGERAFPPLAPVTAEDVRERLRSWKEKHSP